MDILLHITGLAFIPMMIYILFLGLKDVISVWHSHCPPQWKSNPTSKRACGSHQFYQFSG